MSCLTSQERGKQEHETHFIYCPQRCEYKQPVHLSDFVDQSSEAGEAKNESFTRDRHCSRVVGSEYMLMF